MNVYLSVSFKKVKSIFQKCCMKLHHVYEKNIFKKHFKNFGNNECRHLNMVQDKFAIILFLQIRFVRTYRKGLREMI